MVQFWFDFGFRLRVGLDLFAIMRMNALYRITLDVVRSGDPSGKLDRDEYWIVYLFSGELGQKFRLHTYRNDD